MFLSKSHFGVRYSAYSPVYSTFYAAPVDNTAELSHITGIPIFTTHLDDTLYVSGRVTARNRSMAIVTKLKTEVITTQHLHNAPVYKQRFPRYLQARCFRKALKYMTGSGAQ